MKKTKPTERAIAITQLLTREPGRLFTLREFTDLFGCAKSTLSEDITALRSVFNQYSLGHIESISGAAGGIRYHPINKGKGDAVFVAQLCQELSRPERILGGGFLYAQNILSDPRLLVRMAEIFLKRFYESQPDIVLTAETMGVPIALMVARALGKPLVIARRNSHIWDGSVVALSYMNATSQQVQTMSLPRRAISSKQNALIIDDFMRSGGTISALCTMMEEFDVHVCGIGVIVGMGNPPLLKSRQNACALIRLGRIDKKQGTVDAQPASWLC